MLKTCGFLLYREDGPEEKDFQFLFLETEIKNSWEAYFEDAKQKLGKHFIVRNLFWRNFFLFLHIIEHDFFFQPMPKTHFLLSFNTVFLSTRQEVECR